MLERAQDKIDRNGWRHIRVMEMDAMDLDFPESCFDYVMAFHVVSVVPDASRLMAEAQRVCRPGGTLAVVNHFQSENKLLAAIDRRLEPLTRRCGWHTLKRSDLIDGLPLEVVRESKTSRLSLFTILIARNSKPESVARVAARG
jgi:phosphatidylethanolamine/phosphatidyl-N-methylethanolamine N-methyltransferase